MRYLIYYKKNGPDERCFFTNYYSYENTHLPGMLVIDLEKQLFTENGTTWNPINEDVL